MHLVTFHPWSMKDGRLYVNITVSMIALACFHVSAVCCCFLSESQWMKTSLVDKSSPANLTDRKEAASVKAAGQTNKSASEQEISLAGGGNCWTNQELQ